MGEFQSGQMGQTVNLLLLASVVRIHPLPPQKPRHFVSRLNLKLKMENYSFSIPNFPLSIFNFPFFRGYSSAGRVLDWQSRGHGFEPRYLHFLCPTFCLTHFFCTKNEECRTHSTFLTPNWSFIRICLLWQLLQRLLQPQLLHQP